MRRNAAPCKYGVDYIDNAEAKKSEKWTPLMFSIKERMESVARATPRRAGEVYPDGEARNRLA